MAQTFESPSGTPDYDGQCPEELAVYDLSDILRTHGIEITDGLFLQTDREIISAAHEAAIAVLGITSNILVASEGVAPTGARNDEPAIGLEAIANNPAHIDLRTGSVYVFGELIVKNLSYSAIMEALSAHNQHFRGSPKEIFNLIRGQELSSRVDSDDLHRMDDDVMTLHKLGFLECQQDPEDKRKFLYSISDSHGANMDKKAVGISSQCKVYLDETDRLLIHLLKKSETGLLIDEIGRTMVELGHNAEYAIKSLKNYLFLMRAVRKSNARYFVTDDFELPSQT